MADSSRTTHRDDDDDAPASRRSASRGSFDDANWDEAVNEWISSHMRNSAMSAAPTEAWNHMISSLAELRKILEKKL